MFGTNKKNMAQWMQSHNSKKTISVLLFPVLGLVDLISYLQPLFTLQKQNFVCTSLLTMSATYPTHLILLDLITPMLIVEQYVVLTSSPNTFLQPAVTSCVLGSKMFFSAPCCVTPSIQVWDFHNNQHLGCILLAYNTK